MLGGGVDLQHLRTSNVEEGVNARRGRRPRGRNDEHGDEGGQKVGGAHLFVTMCNAGRSLVHMNMNMRRGDRPHAVRTHWSTSSTRAAMVLGAVGG